MELDRPHIKVHLDSTGARKNGTQCIGHPRGGRNSGRRWQPHYSLGIGSEIVLTPPRGRVPVPAAQGLPPGVLTFDKLDVLFLGFVVFALLIDASLIVNKI